jgi:ribosomal protein S18 acetylase RimI-like enzyme
MSSSPAHVRLECTAGALLPVPPIPGLVIETVTAQADLAAIVENLNLNERGFDPDAPPTTIEQAEQFRLGMSESAGFTARLHGVGVGAGMHLAIRDGMTELVGITTLVPYRGRGIGAVLTSAIARRAFDHGADSVFLVTDNPVAQRLYRRLGFS